MRSRSGFILFHGKSAIHWGTTRHPIVSLSTCESEFYAIVLAAKESIHIQRLLQEIDQQGIYPVIAPELRIRRQNAES
jgi:hypothetical protein